MGYELMMNSWNLDLSEQVSIPLPVMKINSGIKDAFEPSFVFTFFTE
jgi:hypothetical protein